MSTGAVFRAFNRTKMGRLKNDVRVTDVPNLSSFIDANNLVPSLM